MAKQVLKSRILRIEAEILDDVAVEASKENRSSNAFIITAIIEKLQRLEREKEVKRMDELDRLRQIKELRKLKKEVV